MEGLDIAPKKLYGTEGYDYGFGDCLICGKSIEATAYWLGPNIVYRVGKDVYGSLFTLGHNKPFCSTQCSLKYHQRSVFTNLPGQRIL